MRRATPWLIAALALAAAPALAINPEFYAAQWPNTDFAMTSVDYGDIQSGGPPKDGIPSIDAPQFVPVGQMSDLGPDEPVIGLEVGGEARAYPLRILTWHEIVNDEIAGIPLAITYCPLCNAAIVFDRRLPDGRAPEFGTTGMLRNSDLIMYDRASESWWQQFSGAAIVGELLGTKLKTLPARLEAWRLFKARHPDGQVLIPNDPDMRPYGQNPYFGYDSAARPFLYSGDTPEGIEPMARVVAIGDQAWPLARLVAAGRIEEGGYALEWTAGQNSALDAREIAKGRDVGNVVARDAASGEEVAYDVTFAFVFHAFRPEGVWRFGD